MTRRADPYLAGRTSHLLRQSPEGRYLDLACGTGNYTVALARAGGAWTGVDPSAAMIEQARAKSEWVEWCRAPAEALTLPDAAMDGVTCILGVHHFADLDAAFHEVRRVLGSGQFVIFTSSPEQMQRYWLCEYFPTAMERSIAQMPSFEAVERACLRAGFARVERETYRVRSDLADGFLYVGKHRPELYLSDEARAGSSTFTLLAEPDEVRAGCERLEADLRSGRFPVVRRRYDDELGDYGFVCAFADALR